MSDFIPDFHPVSFVPKAIESYVELFEEQVKAYGLELANKKILLLDFGIFTRHIFRMECFQSALLRRLNQCEQQISENEKKIDCVKKEFASVFYYAYNLGLNVNCVGEEEVEVGGEEVEVGEEIEKEVFDFKLKRITFEIKYAQIYFCILNLRREIIKIGKKMSKCEETLNKFKERLTLIQEKILAVEDFYNGMCQYFEGLKEDFGVYLNEIFSIDSIKERSTSQSELKVIDQCVDAITRDLHKYYLHRTGCAETSSEIEMKRDDLVRIKKDIETEQKFKERNESRMLSLRHKYDAAVLKAESLYSEILSDASSSHQEDFEGVDFLQYLESFNQQLYNFFLDFFSQDKEVQSDMDSIPKFGDKINSLYEYFVQLGRLENAGWIGNVKVNCCVLVIKNLYELDSADHSKLEKLLEEKKSFDLTSVYKQPDFSKGSVRTLGALYEKRFCK